MSEDEHRPPPDESGDDLPSFDTTDARTHLDWQSRYTAPEARRAIAFDAAYTGAMLLFVVLSYLILWLEYPRVWLHIPDAKYGTIFYYGIAWISGTLGGTLFDLKWLYHSVAWGWWNLDRRWWRLFTPHISGGVAFAVIALLSADVIKIFDSAAVKSSIPTVVGVAFLVGYFSDSAIAKLSELADTLFGVVKHRKERRLPVSSGSSRAFEVEN